MPFTMHDAFAVKDAMVAAFGAAVALPGPIEGVQVEDSWPDRGVQKEESILVLDFEGDTRTATLRAGGGTLDDEIRIEVVAAVWGAFRTAAACRQRAGEVYEAMVAIIEGERGKPSTFGLPKVRNATVDQWKAREYLVTNGRRECDIHATLKFTARRNATRV